MNQIASHLRFGLFLACALLLQPVMTDARKNSPDQAITIDVEQPQSEIHKFDPTRPPSACPPIPPGLNAVTPYDFACFQESWLQDVGEFTDANGNVHVQEKPSWFKIRITLKTGTWLPNTASDKLREHEAGHVEIYQAIYQKRAEAAARAAAQSLLTQVIEGIGPDAETAKKDIQHKVTQALCGQFHHATKDVAVQADNKYDAMTDHGRNRITSDFAVKQIIAEIIEPQPSPAPSN